MTDTEKVPDYVVDFDDVAIASKDGTPVLIDVRNQDEYDAGYIPGSVLVPLPEVADAFQLSPDEFEKKYKFPLPGKDDQFVITCRSGRRALQAKERIEPLGFNKIMIYSGSYLDWVAKGGEVMRPNAA